MFTNRLKDALDVALQSGWKNVTNLVLKDTMGKPGVTGLVSPETWTRKSVTPARVFLQLFSKSMMEHIASQSKSISKKGKPSITAHDIQMVVALYVQCCAERVFGMEEHVRDKTRIGVSRRKYEHIRKRLVIDVQHLFDQFNANTHSITTVSGESAVDETILPFEGESPHIVFIPRKPHDTGIRLYLHCYRLTATSLPICYSVFPDVNDRTMTPRNVLDQTVGAMTPGTSIVADSFFSSMGWLQSKQHVPTLFSMTNSDLSELAMLFTHNLRFHQYRVFSNDKVMVSVWSDNSIIMCGSNRFQVGLEAKQNLANKLYSPIVEEGEMKIMVNALKLETLREIARKIGESTGDLCYIVRVIVLLLIFSFSLRWHKRRNREANLWLPATRDQNRWIGER